MIARLSTKYTNEDVEFVFGRYADGSTAIQAFSEYGEPIAKATVCLAAQNELPLPGNVFIKDWEENEGVLESLVSSGIVSSPIREIAVGPYGCTAYECKVLRDK